VSYNSAYPRSGLHVPRKIRQLKSDLRKAGFIERTERGKGSHAVWEHPMDPTAFVTLSGKDGADAQPYQERQVRVAIAHVQRAERTPE
jgi:predicted RNA binding protein YcfA (HicA-like mRNA interferase family)